eukprot:361871-Chlamydomonas_euryale.AAC.18
MASVEVERARRRQRVPRRETGKSGGLMAVDRGLGRDCALGSADARAHFGVAGLQCGDDGHKEPGCRCSCQVNARGSSGYPCCAVTCLASAQKHGRVTALNTVIKPEAAIPCQPLLCPAAC